jgi:cell division inhibitor SepF
MAGAMRKMAVYLGLVEDEEPYDYDDGYDDDFRSDHRPDHRSDHRDEDIRSVRRTDSADRTQALRTYADRGERRPVRGLATVEEHPAAASSALQPADIRQITSVHPRTYNEARTIGEHFRDGIPVIMNLTEMDDADAKRLVDFGAGLTFGLHGSIERVAKGVFLLSPQNIEVTAEDKARMAEGGFFNQS